LFIAFTKYEGSAVTFGFVPPPPCPPILYEIVEVVFPATVFVVTSEAASTTEPSMIESEPIPINPFNVRVFLTNTRYPFVFNNTPELIVRLL
jgi:hypothetical protein